MCLSCAGVAFENGAVFVARRGAGGAMAGTWEFPGGKVEAGEDVPAALAREFMEELGVAIVCEEKLAECVFVHKGTERRLVAYRVRFSGGVLTLREHSECRWVSLAEAAALVWTPSDFQIFSCITEKLA
ncbi:MAG: NUDIX domain-containing protein [Spirochaetaceae bacterium]|jgi:8-oxo-dGTP diphosphatase|nr:NUDIX domain-containing protein [Spirochaetaceae bacterium]